MAEPNKQEKVGSNSRQDSQDSPTGTDREVTQRGKRHQPTNENNPPKSKSRRKGITPDRWIELVLIAGVLIFSGLSYLTTQQSVEGVMQANDIARIALSEAQQARITDAASDESVLEQMKGQTKAMQGFVDVTSENAEEDSRRFQLERRAWMVSVDARLSAPFNRTQRLTWLSTAVNSGATPALNVRVFISTIYSLNYPLPDDFPIYLNTAPPLSEWDVAPGAGVPMRQPFGPMNVTADPPVLRATRPVYIYFVGTIQYEDVFGIPHETRYCHYKLTSDSSLPLTPCANWHYMR